MTCQINYALWWCSTHDGPLTKNGKCPKGAKSKQSRARNKRAACPASTNPLTSKSRCR